MQLLLKNKVYNIWVEDSKIYKNNGYIELKTTQRSRNYKSNGYNKHCTLIDINFARIDIRRKDNVLKQSILVNLAYNNNYKAWKFIVKTGKEVLNKAQEEYILKLIYSNLKGSKNSVKIIN